MIKRGVPPNHVGGVRSPAAPPAPSVSFFQLTELSRSKVPAIWKSGSDFSITRLQSFFVLNKRIIKASSVKALLVSVSLRSIPLGGYLLWADTKQVPTSYVPAFRSNVIDFDAGPACWADQPFDFVHYHVPRGTLDDIAEDWGFGPVSEYRQSLIEQDLVLAQMTRNIVPSISQEKKPCSLALDQFQLLLGAHLVQRYGRIATVHPPKMGGLARWQKQRAMELLRENLDGNVRLSDLAKECGLSVSHFGRSFKAAFGVSSHQWLIHQRINRAKDLLAQTKLPLSDVAAQAGFGDQPAFTRTFHRVVGTSPGNWRREHQPK
jgi:AraC family transcriptional regulator